MRRGRTIDILTFLLIQELQDLTPWMQVNLQLKALGTSSHWVD